VCSPVRSPKARAKTIRRQLEYLQSVCDRHPDRIYAIRDAAALAVGLERGTLGAFPGIEGAHALGGDLDNLRVFYELGARYLTFAHFSGNEACQCAMGLGSSKGREQGLTDFGRRLLDECTRLGVVIDAAHVNKKGFMEICERAERPVIVSHTGVTGVKKIWRNIDDEQIEAVAKTGGVVGIIFGPQFVGRSWLDDARCVAEHILHVVQVAGADHAAYGSDIDGWLWTMPKGLYGIDELPNVTALLLAAGLDEGDVKKIIGGNVKTVLERAL
jgi:membrane dipeptidase